MNVRAAEAVDHNAIVRIWHYGWHEAHANHVPEALVMARSHADFADRLDAMMDRTRVIGTPGQPVGFCTIRADELMHLFVAHESRGIGIAQALLRDGEERLHEADIEVAWLACVIGNVRAARFYEKHGWMRVGDMEYFAETESGSVHLTEWRYEKRL